MQPWNCSEHGQFISEQDFAQHMEEIHGASMPTPEFMEIVRQAGGGSGIKPLDFSSAAPPVFTPETVPQKVELPKGTAESPEPVEPKTAKPMKLIYQYEGDCPTCFSPIKTIMLNMGNSNKKGSSLYATAYCITCSKQLDARKVEPL